MDVQRRRRTATVSRLVSVALVALLAVVVAGCSSGGSTTTTTPASQDSSTPQTTPATSPASNPSTPAATGGLSGKWTGTYSGTQSGTFTLTWKEGSSKLTGIIDLSPGGKMPINGVVTNGAIKFGTVGSLHVTYAGQVSGDGNSMAGTYQINGQQAGTWTAKRA